MEKFVVRHFEEPRRRTPRDQRGSAVVGEGFASGEAITAVPVAPKGGPDPTRSHSGRAEALCLANCVISREGAICLGTTGRIEVLISRRSRLGPLATTPSHRTKFAAESPGRHSRRLPWL